MGFAPANNDGDIIAQWDVQAHRWLLTQNVFTGNYGVCVAISTSNDATGTYYLYEFPVVNNGFPDYPKWGAWVNDWAETWNNFGPAAATSWVRYFASTTAQNCWLATRRRNRFATNTPLTRTACCLPTSIR